MVVLRKKGRFTPKFCRALDRKESSLLSCDSQNLAKILLRGINTFGPQGNKKQGRGRGMVLIFTLVSVFEMHDEEKRKRRP